MVRGTSTRQPNSGLVSNQDSALLRGDGLADHGDRRARQVSGLTPAALRSAGTEPSVVSTVCCSVVVPFQVMASGVDSFQPAATSILPRSARPASAPSTTRLPGPAATGSTSDM